MHKPSQRRRIPFSVVIPVLALLMAVAMQGVEFVREPARARPAHLASLVPARSGSWTGQDVPLGASEFLSNEVGRILNFDEILNREYVNGARRFGVYIAYWGPGRMPVRLVASHTPDRCWTENGWRCLEMKFRQTGIFGEAHLQPAEWRRFEPPQGGAPMHVVYWHLVDGRAYDYGARFNSVPDPVQWWRDAVHQALAGSSEQYFVRITSPQPLEELVGDPGFETILRGLENLGLRLPAPVRLSPL